MAKKKNTAIKTKVAKPCRRCGKAPAKCGYRPKQIEISDFICKECASKRNALAAAARKKAEGKAPAKKKAAKSKAAKPPLRSNLAEANPTPAKKRVAKSTKATPDPVAPPAAEAVEEAQAS